MPPSTILVVEDNPTTLKMIRVAIEGEGYKVLASGDGRGAIEYIMTRRPDLVLQDLVLPDMDGFELARRLRAAPGGDEIPIIAFSGFLSKMEQVRSLQVGFTDYLFKPVEPSQLLQTIRTHLRSAEANAGTAGQGRRILVVNDDPVQLKLLKASLEQCGFRVTLAADGMEALELARLSPPDAILSDVLMPRMDGFRLSLNVRLHPELRKVPVILLTAAYTEDADQQLAQTVGANALLTSPLDSKEMAEVLLANLRKAPELPGRPVELVEQYTHRLIRQLERHVSLNAGLSQRLALREAELAILAGLTQTLKSTTAVRALLQELLHRSLDAAGVCWGAAYLVDPEGVLSVQANLGYPNDSAGGLADFFGYAELLRQAIDTGEPVQVPSPQLPYERGGDLLEKAGAASILIAPLAFGEERLGALVMASTGRELGEDWIPFAKAVGNEVGQSVCLARTLSLLRESEEKTARIVDTMVDGLVMTDRNGRVTFANAAAERIFGQPAAGLKGHKYSNFGCTISTVDGHPLPEAESAAAQVIETSQTVRDVEWALERPDGSQLILSTNAAPIRDAEGNIVGVVRSLRDITRRKRTEKELVRQAEQLARYNAELEQFAYVAAHDLQEPLRTVASFTQLLARRYKGQLDPQADKYIDLVVGGCARMRQLIDGLLGYFRIARRVEPEPREPAHCDAIFQQSMASLASAVEETGAVVTHDPLPTVVADAGGMGQVFLNLLGNALKFHGLEPPRVHVSAERKAGEWVFSVRDNGIGIDSQYAERIFGIFERLHRKQDYPGAGIGLAVCKKIVEQHGGRIWVESEPGKGATFYFTVPVDLHPTAPQPTLG